MDGSLGFVVAPQPRPALDPVAIEVARLRREGRDRLVESQPSVTVAMLAEGRDASVPAARQWLHRHRRAGHLVTVTLDDGTTLVPTFQLDRDLEPHPDVTPLVGRMVGAGMGPWAVWGWWANRHGWLGAAPVELLVADGGPDRIREALQRTLEPTG